MKNLTGILLGFAIFLSGCSPLPEAANINTSPQSKLQSAQHWGIVARHISSRLIEHSDAGQKSIYINENNLDTEFSHIFSKQLVSELVSNKVNLKLSPSKESLELLIEVDAIRHPNDRDGSRISWTAVYANAWLIGSLKEHAALGLVPTAIAADHVNSIASRTNTEIVITTKLIDQNNIHFSESNVYYITDLSIRQFKKFKRTFLTNKEYPGAL